MFSGEVRQMSPSFTLYTFSGLQRLRLLAGALRTPGKIYFPTKPFVNFNNETAGYLTSKMSLFWKSQKDCSLENTSYGSREQRTGLAFLEKRGFGEGLL